MLGYWEMSLTYLGNTSLILGRVTTGQIIHRFNLIYLQRNRSHHHVTKTFKCEITHVQ